MHIQIDFTTTSSGNQIVLLNAKYDLNQLTFSPEEINYISAQRDKLKKDWVAIPRFPFWTILAFSKDHQEQPIVLENRRRQGFAILSFLNQNGCSEAVLSGIATNENENEAFIEGMILGNYQFLKYRKDAEDKLNAFRKLQLMPETLDEKRLDRLKITTEAVMWARNLVNEPLNSLNAEDLAEQISQEVKKAGGKAEIFNKKKIEALKMGGLLAVNRGSIDPPTFTILEWKPDLPVSNKPIVLVGKGVVYDTGGMSLKPANSMDTMKCDMSGSATASAVLAAAARMQLPVHLIALVPATDNRVDGNAYVPGDVITMFDGTTVEVLNTDAEGRLLLADALTYAKKFDPELVITFATLTGAATRAIGSQGIVAMQVKADKDFEQLTKSGLYVHERLAAFPMWDEYKEQLKSEIADLKNIGGAEAGMITAAKFLEHFTDYPFIHLDIAGTAYLEKRDSYRGFGGTGIGIRLILDFLHRKID